MEKEYDSVQRYKNPLAKQLIYESYDRLLEHGELIWKKGNLKLLLV